MYQICVGLSAPSKDAWLDSEGSDGGTQGSFLEDRDAMDSTGLGSTWRMATKVHKKNEKPHDVQEVGLLIHSKKTVPQRSIYFLSFRPRIPNPSSPAPRSKTEPGSGTGTEAAVPE
jgi:hypothetical protein